MKNLKMLYLLIAVSVGLVGCATATSYQPLDVFDGGGYTETQLDENVFDVEFSGNGYTGGERARNFTLLRCAELTLQNDYAFFVIIIEEQSSDVSTSTFTTPTTTTYGTTYSATTTTTSKPTARNKIVMFKEKPDDVFSYNAKFIENSIKAKYGIGS